MQAQQQSLLPEFPINDKEKYDIVLVTGDAYVDHPAFGAALIGRFLESRGYRVGIIAQPDWKNCDDFRRFGRPRLFFGVTAGNLDSIVANYTPDRRRRTKDSYSPGGAAGLRPDYATVVYSQRCKEAYPDSVVVMGGIEASLRRFAHFDFVKQKVFPSVLTRAKADFLVYGMAERAVAELADALSEKKPSEILKKIRGLGYLAKSGDVLDESIVELPSYEAVEEDKNAFLEFHKKMSGLLLEPSPPAMVQNHGAVSVVMNSPSEPLSTRELDALYALHFTRSFHPRHNEAGGIPALAPVQFSITAHRGCYGGCSFCALTAHQGKAVVSRSAASVADEISRLSKMEDFRGTITDIGGPTANMYGSRCAKAAEGKTGCSRPSCLSPDICPHLDANGAPFLELLRTARKVSGVKHVFVASGLRHDLLLLPGQRRLLRELMKRHVGGQMKIAPEHTASRPLKLMRKPYARKYREFVKLFDAVKRELEKDIYHIPYLMTGHPGSGINDAVELSLFVKSLGRFAEQIQSFTPTPMTDSSCMFYTGRDPSTGEEVIVPRGREANIQRALAQSSNPENKNLLIDYFESRGRRDILFKLYGPGYKKTAQPRSGPKAGPKTGQRPSQRPGRPQSAKRQASIKRPEGGSKPFHKTRIKH